MNGSPLAFISWDARPTHSPTLDVESLMNEAVETTGLCDFGDPSFRKPFELLIEGLRAEANLTAAGRERAIDLVMSKLQARLQVVGAHTQHPEIGVGRIDAPIFIIGLPRTGSTLVHHLFGVDDCVRVPRRWELLRPWPAPETATYAHDSRIEMANQELRECYGGLPQLHAMHPMRGDFPDECIHILMGHFSGALFRVLYGVPTSQRALTRGDLCCAYRFHKLFLQVLQWRCPATPWILKCPEHLGHLESIIEVYPRARFVWLHRDPVSAITSATHLCSTMKQVHCVGVDPAATASRLTEEWSQRVRVGMEQRARFERLDNPWHDLWYDELLSDPLSCMAELYAWAGLVLPYGTLFKMRDYLAHPPYPRGGYTHDPKRLGIDTARIEREFADYINAYFA